MSDQVQDPTNPNPAPAEETPIVAQTDAQGKKTVDLDALLAERRTGKEKLTKQEEAHKKELAELQAKIAQYEPVVKDLERIRPDLEFLQQNPDIRTRTQQPQNPLNAIGNDEAERFARRYELYTANGLDIQRAKQIIHEQREEIRKIAREESQQAVQPALKMSAGQYAQQNLAWALSQKSADGRLMADPQIVRDVFSKVGEGAADPNVAYHLLNVAIGETVRQGKTPTAAPQYEPVFSEPAGGRRGQYVMSNMEKAVSAHTGIKPEDWQKTASKYVPGAENPLGE